MQFSEAWLKRFVDPQLEPAALCHLLTMAGLEVESAEAAAPPFSGVVVGRILAAERHPDADRLQVCQVDVGAGEPLTVVCGAANARVGLNTACAQVGAELPGLRIGEARVRGVASFGMLCSAGELGIAEAADGILELPAEAPVGQPLRDFLELDDRILTLKLTPNRGDCLSVRGVAREVAAVSGAVLTDVVADPVAAVCDDQLPVYIHDLDACPVYRGRIIRDIDAAARTPEWMARRLQRSGLRPIHPVVDVTNYVLLELGQPMHAFDLATLAEAVEVRRARPGERLALLDEQTLTLTETQLVIADRRAPLALAGIMGGMDSAVSAASRDIFLEAAHFTPAAMAGRARSLGLATDSSHRFERGVDPALPALAMEYATRLILEICGGRPGPVVSAGIAPTGPEPIVFRPERARRLIGEAIDDATIRSLFSRLGLGVKGDGEAWTVAVPGFRFDLRLEVDLIEEVARLRGYDQIPAKVPRSDLHLRGEAGSAGGVDRRLVALGYQEVVTYSFISASQQEMVAPGSPQIALLNPIASQMGVMRGSLLPGLIQTLRHNLNHGVERLRIFESGRCFLGTAADRQPLRLAALAYGSARPEQWGETTRRVDFFDLKADLEALLRPAIGDYVAAPHPALHPGQSARVEVDGVALGWLGTLHPRLVQAFGLSQVPVVFELDVAMLPATATARYRSLSRHPAVRRDIAVVVDAGFAVGELLEAVRGSLPARMVDFALFDVYQGKGIQDGKKSLAFKMLLQDTDKTLTDAEIDAAVGDVVGFLVTRFGAELRA